MNSQINRELVAAYMLLYRVFVRLCESYEHVEALDLVGKLRTETVKAMDVHTFNFAFDLATTTDLSRTWE